MIPVIFSRYLKRGLAAVVACFLLNSSALAYVPAVHEALHAHEDACPDSRAADSKDLCSAQNHLAADLSLDIFPDGEIFQLLDEVLFLRETRPVFFAEFNTSPRAPPVSPAHP